MIIDIEDLDKVKYPATFFYTVFKVSSKSLYDGKVLIGARTRLEALNICKDFRDSDPKNEKDSWGWGDLTDSGQLADKGGLLENFIIYTGR